MAVYNSSSITRDSGARGIGVYPVKVLGTITLASNTTLSSATTDTLPICKIPFGCFISDIKIGFPAIGTQASLGLKLVDTLASPTTYITAITAGQAGGLVSYGSASAADLVKMGTMYGNTARTVGSTGQAVVVWTAGVQLNLAVITTSTASSGATALNITYMIEFSPNYDMGV
jgi:hypothetical protein